MNSHEFSMHVHTFSQTWAGYAAQTTRRPTNSHFRPGHSGVEPGVWEVLLIEDDQKHCHLRDIVSYKKKHHITSYNTHKDVQ